MKLGLSAQNILRQQFAAHAAPGADIRHILMVGAKTQGFRTVSFEDDRYMQRCFSALSRTGMPVAPDFEVSVVNIAQNEGREDFLKGGFCADIVMLNYIFNPKTYDEAETLANKWCMEDCRVSPRHFEDGAWHDAVAATGARGVYIVGRPPLEVTEEHFNRPGALFVPVQETRCAIPLLRERSTSGVLLVRRTI